MNQKTILVVEDEALIALNQKQILERNGYNIRIAYNGASAVEIAAGSVVSAATGAANISSPGDNGDPESRDTPIDLILMDIDLGPGIDGTEAARRILAHREIPVVFLSSHTEREIVEKTEEISSYGYIVKHSGEMVLIASIRMAFRLYEAHRQQKHTNGYLRTVLETLPSGFWVSDETGTIRDVNEGYCRISGFTRSELIGKKIAEIAEIDEIDDEQDVIERSKAILQGAAVRFQTRHRRKNGEVIPVAVSARRVDGTEQPRFVCFCEDLSLDRGRVMSHTGSGEPEWVFGTHQEITDQVHARERLERSEANFRAFFDTSIDYLWVFDETGKILDVNASVTNNLGYTKEKLLGRSVLEMYPPDRRDEAAEIVAAMIAGTHSSCPIPLLTVNGARVPVETYLMRATWNDAPAFFGISRDISALALSEEKYAKMFNTSPAMVTLSEYDTGILVDVNEAFCRTLGFTRDEVIGHASTEIIGLDTDFRMKALSEIETEGHVDNLETTITTKEGDPLEVLLSAAVITVQDSRYTFTTAIDITERKLAERGLERSVATERTLMAELNHRVKNNLAMVGSLLRLKDAELGDSADLADIHARVEAITSLHEELQHAGGVGEVALDSYLGRVISNVVANSSIPVTVTLDLCDRRIPTKIAVPLGLIINELATNAVKYGFNLIVPPELTVRESIRDGACTITVTNSGNPFPADVDLDNPTTMGLRLVSMLVNQISGTVALERTPKTEISITFPVPVV